MKKQVQFVDVTLRDGQQSLAATRMTTPQALSILPLLRDAGFGMLELWGGAVLDSCVRFLNEDPWERLDQFRETLGGPQRIRALLRGQNLFAYQPYPDDLVIAFIREATRSGVGLMRIFDALNDLRNLQMAILATKAYGGKVEAAVSYTTSPIHTADYFVTFCQTLQAEGVDQIAFKDMAGLLDPHTAAALLPKLRQAIQVPLTFHSHTTTGVATLTAVIAMQAGFEAIDTAITPFAGGSSHPPVEILLVFAEEMGLDHGLDKALILKAQEKLFDLYAALRDSIPGYGKFYRPVRYEDVDRRVVTQVLSLLQRGDAAAIDQATALTRKLLTDLKYPDYEDSIFQSQVPGGMISNLQNQLKQMGKLDLLDQILEEIPTVRRDVGYVPLVTPTSQIVGSQAAFNVMFGRYEMVPNEFKMLLRGEFGRTPAAPNPEIVNRVLSAGDKPLRYRPASYLTPVLEDPCDLPYVQTHRDLLLHLMLKQSADEFLKRKYAR